MTEKKYRYASRDMVVFGRVDFEDQLSLVELAAGEAHDNRPVEVQIKCASHFGSGVLAIYEDGMIVLGCHACGRRIGQVEVAERGRPWGKVVSN